MIAQVNIQLQKSEAPYTAAVAYPLYAWLLSQVNQVDGDALHSQDVHPITQHVWYDNTTHTEWWTVNLLTDAAIDTFLPILEQAEQAELHRQKILFTARRVERNISAQQLLQRARTLPEVNRYTLRIVTPTAFKQNGRYAIFPQESLILQSLVNRWELCFPEFSLSDPDAMQAILRGLHITDYKLQTLRHPLKQTRLPGFVGRIILDTHLPAPLAEVVKTLYCFAPYAGLGVKTTLGMGGVQIDPPAPPSKQNIPTP